MKKKISLKWKIGRYLLLFAFLVIGMIWILQMFLLQPMYESSKVRALTDTAEHISSALSAEGEDLADVIYSESMGNDTCVRIFSSDIDMIAGNSGCALYHMSSREINQNTKNALENDGTWLSRSGTSDPRGRSQQIRNITYTKILEVEDERVVLMVNTGITPLNATTDTLRKQLYLISAFIIVSLLFLTLLLNKTITKPLSAITAETKHLPEGEFRADESNSKYLEAQLLNEALQQAAVDIRQADQAKKDLIANVSHDLRTPLTMITGYGEMMRDLPGENTGENLQVIIDESKRLTCLVNDLLDLSKLQAGKIVLEKEVFDLAVLIREEMKKYEVYETREQFEFECVLTEGLKVYADPNRIAQVFNNFMSNAINYSSDSRRIIIRAEKTSEGIRTSVRDFGEGIEKDKLADIWDRYYKVDRRHVRPVSGSGIGLSIVKEILDLHGASYGVESEKDKGSTFWFILPPESTSAE